MDVKLSKVEGPTTSITFLGIHLNSLKMKASISDERKDDLLNELHRWDAGTSAHSMSFYPW